MPKFGGRSEGRRDTCTPGLIAVLNKGIERVDYTILCGHRGREAQDQAEIQGTTTKKWPNSKHNSVPSVAVDVAPWYKVNPHLDWRTDKALWVAVRDGNAKVRDEIMENIKRWFALIHYLVGVGDGLGVKLRSGGDWDMDFQFDDHRLVDLPHLEEIV